MLYQSHNPYSVLSENISFENVQQIGKLITLKALRGFLAFSRQSFEKLYIAYVKDLNRLNYPTHTFSDVYDLAQTAICFLCDFIGKELTDVYTIKNGKVITIKQATYALVCRHVNRIRRHYQRSCDIELYSESLSVEINHYQEKDYTEVDNKIELLNLKPRDNLTFTYHSLVKYFILTSQKNKRTPMRNRISFPSGVPFLPNHYDFDENDFLHNVFGNFQESDFIW